MSQQEGRCWGGRDLASQQLLPPQDLHHLGHQQLVPSRAGPSGPDGPWRSPTCRQPQPVPQRHFNGNRNMGDVMRGRGGVISDWSGWERAGARALSVLECHCAPVAWHMLWKLVGFGAGLFGRRDSRSLIGLFKNFGSRVFGRSIYIFFTRCRRRGMTGQALFCSPKLCFTGLWGGDPYLAVHGQWPQSSEQRCIEKGGSSLELATPSGSPATTMLYSEPEELPPGDQKQWTGGDCRESPSNLTSKVA